MSLSRLPARHRRGDPGIPHGQRCRYRERAITAASGPTRMVGHHDRRPTSGVAAVAEPVQRTPGIAGRRSCAADGQDHGGPGEWDFSAAIYEVPAPTTRAILADEPVDLLGGRAASSGVGRWACCWASCRGNSRSIGGPSPGPNLAIGNTIVLKARPRSRLRSAEALEQIFTDAGFLAGAYVNVYATNGQIARDRRSDVQGRCRR